MDATIWFIAWQGIEWFIRLVAVFTVPRGRKPTSGLSWLMVIFLVPIPGAIAFAIFGSHKLSKSRRELQRSLDNYIATEANRLERSRTLKHLLSVELPAQFTEVARLNQSLTYLPVVAGNNIELLIDYEGIIDRIIEDIDRATKTVHVEFYILALDQTTLPFFNALTRAAERGVTVRVLYDAFGSRRYSRYKEMKQRLERDGIKAHAMLPFNLFGKNYVRPDLRNHRKLVTIDSKVGYTGSMNMITRNYHRRDHIVYDELMVRLTGPIVNQLQIVFLTDWLSESGELLRDTRVKTSEPKSELPQILMQLLPSGPGYEDENNLKVFNSAIYAATESVIIVNPYFVPDTSLSMALISAARRGVRVCIINSEVMDQPTVGHAQRSYYEEMLEAGVEIHLYKGPALLHSKFITVDNKMSLVGSSNMDIRSFELNHELMVLIYDPATTEQLTALASEYQRRSIMINQQAWSARPLRKKLLDNLARLTSSLQ